MTAPTQTDLGPTSAEGLEPPPNAIRCTIPILFLENFKTGDDRLFETAEGNGHRELPVTLFGLTYTSAGGHEGAQIVGRIDTMTRTPGSEVINPDTSEPFPADCWVWSSDTVWLDTTTDTYALLYAKYLRGVSCDLADYTVEFDWGEEDEEGFVEIDTIRFPTWRIAGATVCPIPAFAGCRIELPDDAPVPVSAASAELGAAITAAAKPSPMGTANVLDDVCAPCLTASSNIPSWAPPVEWFTDPQLTEPTPLTITDDGRIFGHVAEWGACHVGLPGCVTPPHSRTGYAHFLVGETILSDGTRQPTGHLTVAGGHARLTLSADAAVAHYDNAATAVGPVTIGEDTHGIWIAGAVYPDTPPELVARARSSAPSGDWRDTGAGHLELINIHCVNSPGYRVNGVRSHARLTPDGPQTLVAALGPAPDPVDDVDTLRRDVEQLRTLVLGDRVRSDLARILGD
jgi:hypothetical protein